MPTLMTALIGSDDAPPPHACDSRAVRTGCLWHLQPPWNEKERNVASSERFGDLRVLIAGSGAGVGADAAVLLVSEGAHVYVIEPDAERAERLRVMLALHSSRNHVFEIDPSRGSAVREAIARIGGETGRLDALVNNIGDTCRPDKPVAICTDAEITSLYHANLRHAFHVTRNALPLLRSARHATASIVNVCTIDSLHGFSNPAIYSAFRALLNGFTKRLALELERQRIRVHGVDAHAGLSAGSQSLPAPATATRVANLIHADQKRTGRRSALSGNTLRGALPAGATVHI